MSPYNILVILGATASGKTAVAARWAHLNNGEIISADSRQLYRGMTIGTGKDYADYCVDGKTVACHCIDIANPGEQYNVYAYQKDFLKALADIRRRNKIPVLCGGSGLYLEAALKGYRLLQTPVNEALRNELEQKDNAEMETILSELQPLHNRTDTVTRKRMIRAVEIAVYRKEHRDEPVHYPDLKPLLAGILYDRDTRRKRITERLEQRLREGMADEVRLLLDKGLTPEQLEYYGLEYKYLTLYLTGQIRYEQMFDQLNTAIHQFAKRQMTWFRRMERNGDRIHWIDGNLPTEEKIRQITDAFRAPQ
ncbi:MAG: tRNA (adenosine(37)-N6)-dimethylallyltransferase MiaA [Bacteroidales bacterium]|jgi:tRNA dimethylallyltransferase|nr:tRNA (adenosine(37)-N6)-dimethylallyltransferase MiaA [Bacteroidales bacterium]